MGIRQEEGTRAWVKKGKRRGQEGKDKNEEEDTREEVGEGRGRRDERKASWRRMQETEKKEELHEGRGEREGRRMRREGTREEVGECDHKALASVWQKNPDFKLTDFVSGLQS